MSDFLTAIAAMNIEIRRGEPLSRYTSFRIGGPARAIIAARRLGDAVTVIRTAREYGETLKILGGGTNILAPDAGYDGFILLPSWDGVRKIGDVTIEAGAGVSKAALAVYAQREGLAGLEFAHGIPGTVGGGVYMNAGAYGGEMSQVAVSTIAVDSAGNTVEIAAAEHHFSYRASIFRENPGLTILSTRFNLTRDDPAAIRARMDGLMARRRERQPLEYPSAGSVFKRPQGHFAGRLIEDSGLKGYSIGGAQVSEKHAGFIINRGGATSGDVLRLIEYIKTTVLKNYSIELECEIEIW